MYWHDSCVLKKSWVVYFSTNITNECERVYKLKCSIYLVGSVNLHDT